VIWGGGREWAQRARRLGTGSGRGGWERAAGAVSGRSQRAGRAGKDSGHSSWEQERANKPAQV
jgi:hypothetical protein